MSEQSAADTTFRIATRASELALRQARIVQHELESHGQRCELVTFKTLGDRKLDEPLREIGAKGLFTAELEAALAAGKVDCCVHSLKDLPTVSPSTLRLGATLRREDPRDVLVLNDNLGAQSLDEVPRGSRIGTSSLRRRAQLLARRPDLDVVELRGNVPTRIRKVDDGQVHGAILAAAGLVRLGVHQRITEFLESPEWLPAAGQGAIAVQVRADDAAAADAVEALHDGETDIAVRAERAFLAALQGGCQVPIGALAVRDESSWILHGLVADPNGTRVVRGEMRFDASDPESGGVGLADSLLDRGAETILDALRALSSVLRPQPE